MSNVKIGSLLISNSNDHVNEIRNARLPLTLKSYEDLILNETIGSYTKGHSYRVNMGKDIKGFKVVPYKGNEDLYKMLSPNYKE